MCLILFNHNLCLKEYEEISRRRLELNGSQLTSFRRRVQSVVEKDVVRTDRANPYFAGDENPHLDVMKNILLNYAVYNPGLGYVTLYLSFTSSLTSVYLPGTRKV